MLRVVDPQYRAGALDYDVLEAGAGAQQRTVMLARPAECVERTAHALIGTARRAPEPVIGLQESGRQGIERRRGQPGYLKRAGQPVGRVMQGRLGGPVRVVCWLV